MLRVEIALSVDGPIGGRVRRLIPVERADNPAETHRRAIALAEAWGYTNVRLFLEEVTEPSARPTEPSARPESAGHCALGCACPSWEEK